MNRARRGEWLGQAPPGYVIGSDSKLQFDPDEQVQSVIRLILDQFACLGSLSGLLRYLRQHHIEIPYRVPGGPNRGQLQWHRPHRETLRSIVRRAGLCGGLHLGPTGLRSAAEGAGPPRPWSGRTGTARLCRVPAG